MSDAVNDRFVSIETKIAYQEKLIAELNDVLLERGQELDKLQLRLNSLERLARESAPENPGHEPPPHY
jgi:SlyX protein